MLDGLRKLDWAPRSVHRKARAVAKAIREIEAEIGREARDAEVAEQDGRELERVPQIVEDAAGCQIASLTTEEGEINAHRLRRRIRSATWSTRIFARRSPRPSPACRSASGW